MVNVSGKHLLSLVNDLLDLSRIEAGRAEVVFETFDACALMAEVAETLRPLIEERGLRLELECTPGEVAVSSDPAKVMQILLNLGGNATKFTHQGRVHFGVERGDNGEVALAVTDTGSGIAPAELPRMFEAFEQADTVDAIKGEGTGLGLTISSRFAEMLGGRIDAESTVGVGSTFTLVLPA